jgi:hypothetical protein
MRQHLLYILILCYSEIAIASIWALTKKPPRFTAVVIWAIAIIFPSCESHYISLLFYPLDHVRELSLVAPSLVGVVAAALWNPWTLNKEIAYQNELEAAKQLVTLRDKYSLVPEVILKFVDFNTSLIVSLDQTMIDWFVMRELATKEDLKPGVNWWDIISHRQDWKLNNQACAVTHKIFTDQVTYWEEKKIWFKWRMVPLDYESQTYLIQFHDDTETQDKIKSLTDENKRLKAINNQLITKGLQELREGNNDAR